VCHVDSDVSCRQDELVSLCVMLTVTCHVDSDVSCRQDELVSLCVMLTVTCRVDMMSWCHCVSC